MQFKSYAGTGWNGFGNQIKASTKLIMHVVVRQFLKEWVNQFYLQSYKP